MFVAGRGARRWGLVACGFLLVVGWGAFWWLAVPRHEICALTFPAPAGCGAGRVAVAALWSLITAVLYGVALLVAVRAPRSRWPVTVALALILAVVYGFFAVLYA
ncbi:hypothetical protein [Paractinoplanes toevensis]|uniref:Transmembrane protein n=1 Tax=Paractinoplanes toevensis TaxID=571911 RepID=A0A919W556_9ACTN|nr:hypothetical protein [Actinoplanes toevensis]GIM95029.1 hypothetical protein Ato02nite_068220 [Actinoplanes toevensis]